MYIIFILTIWPDKTKTLIFFSIALFLQPLPDPLPLLLQPLPDPLPLVLLLLEVVSPTLQLLPHVCQLVHHFLTPGCFVNNVYSTIINPRKTIKQLRTSLKWLKVVNSVNWPSMFGLPFSKKSCLVFLAILLF